MGDDMVVEEIIKLIKKLNRSILSHERRLVTHSGLTRTQAYVIMHIDKKRPITHGRLSERCHISKSTLSEALNSLEKKGYIHRVRCEKDKRRRYVSLTPAGNMLRSALLSDHGQSVIGASAGMTDLEKKLLFILLKKLHSQV
jgi:MarR family 2-MHQ and catechol resistance regulon transcriptional repressor